MPDYYPDPNKNPYRVSREPVREPAVEQRGPTHIDFETQRICPSCGKIIRISHNFCKYCGVDLSFIRAIGESDRTLKELSSTALNDPDFEVRKDALASLEELGELEILGVLTYALLNDRHEQVRKEAAEKLGNVHNPISLDVLAKALKDKSPFVRKAAIEALKKIKKLNKPIERKSAEAESQRSAEKREERVTESVAKPEEIEGNDEENDISSLEDDEPDDEDMYRL